MSTEQGKKEQGKVYQDRLYGAEVLSPLAVAIIDTAEFQRLAGLRQLGFSDQVFRSATHTRFEHSVGTYFMCQTMMRRIVQNHDRLQFKHPGREISDVFAIYPYDAFPDKDKAKGENEPKRSKGKPRVISQQGKLFGGLVLPPDEPEKPRVISHQARWRGLMEVISAAGLLHDLGHVPFGHTLEDEFKGIFERHDSLASPRLYTMLFHPDSELASVFSKDEYTPWVGKIPNEQLAQLIYVILNWKEQIDEPRMPFDKLLEAALGESQDDSQHQRLVDLQRWYGYFCKERMFHPFMSDIVGNTICADLLDYLPRDRMNLGMDYRQHGRLLRYFTIAQGSLYPAEGLRASILVTRKGLGGQRRDVATTVLDIMRERYQMAERVFYHHRKAAASTMLAKLTELSGLCDPSQKPRDDDRIYPAPWSMNLPKKTDISPIPHMTHFSDTEFIDYLGSAENVPKKYHKLQKRLYQAIRYRRAGVYRTLLVIDIDLANTSPGAAASIADTFRDNKGEERRMIEKELAVVAGAEVQEEEVQEEEVLVGDILIYCPSPKMQAKLVDVRVEIQEGQILPLRVQRNFFTYSTDLDVLAQYYRELWRAYVFVSPHIYKDAAKCLGIVDTLCDRLKMSKEMAYKKVRGHNFQAISKEAMTSTLDRIKTFIENLSFNNTIPGRVITAFIGEAEQDNQFLRLLPSGAVTTPRLSTLFEVATIRYDGNSLKAEDRELVENRCNRLLTGTDTPRLISERSGNYETFTDYWHAARQGAGVEG